MSIDLTTEITRIDESDETDPDHPQVAERNYSKSETEYDNAYVETATVENMKPIETIFANEVAVDAPSEDDAMKDEDAGDRSPGAAAASLHSGGDAAELVVSVPTPDPQEDDAMGDDERSSVKAPSEAAASLHSDEAVSAVAAPDFVPNTSMDEKSLIDSAQDTWRSLQTSNSTEYIDRAQVAVINFFKTNRQLLVALGVALLAIISLKLLFAGLNAIDDLPLVSPLLKVVGLGAVIQFVWRYLIREHDRQELKQAIDRTKAEIFGS